MLFRQARYLGRYRQIGRILARYGFGLLAEQLGLGSLLRLPRRLTRQSAPDALTAPQRLRMALVELGPTYIKLGQVLSTRPDIIPAPYVAELNQLQDTVPPFASDRACALVEADLGQPLEKLFRTFDRCTRSKRMSLSVFVGKPK